jgi:hypothetical protein
MPISDYANAFFFARRNRVTHNTLLSRNPTVFVFSESNRRSVAANDARCSPQLVSISRHCDFNDTTRRKSKIAGRKITGGKNKKPGMAGLPHEFFSISLFRELCDLMGQPRNLSAGIVLVNDVALRCLHQFRLGARHRLEGRITVAALDRFLDGSHRTTHLGPARLIDDSTAGDLSRGLPGGSGIGHILKILRQYPTANRARAMRRNALIDADMFSNLLS